MKHSILALLTIAALWSSPAQAQVGNFSQIRLDATCRVDTGTGSPEGVVTAPVCSIYLRTDGGTGTTFYIKTSGSGNTGWTAFAGTSGTVTTSGSPANGNLAKFTSATAISSADLTGDVTTSGTVSTTIANDAVTNAKLANMAQSTIKGRAVSAGTGDPTDLTATQATAILDAMVGDSGSGGTKGLVPAPASGDAAAGKYLKADGTWDAPSGSGASSSAEYVVLSLNGGLSAERVLTAGSGVTITDGGANGNVTIATTGVMTCFASASPSGTGTVTFNSLGSYTHLQIFWSARGTESANNSVLNLQFNGDTGANYDREQIQGAGSTASASEALAATSTIVGNVVASTGTSDAAGTGTITVYDYRGTTFHKNVLSDNGWARLTTSGNFFKQVFAGRWRSTSAITSITLSLAAGNFVAGSLFTLCGF